MNLDCYTGVSVVSNVALEKSRTKYDGSGLLAFANRASDLRLHAHAHTLALSQEVRLVSPANDSRGLARGAYYNKYTRTCS